MHEDIIARHPESFAELKKGAERKEFLDKTADLSRIKEICGDDNDLNQLLGDVREYCIRYAQILFKYDHLLKEFEKEENSEAPLEKLRGLNEERGVAHDALIDSVQILARNMKKADRDISWISQIGGKENRAAYARFALAAAYRELTKGGNFQP